MRVAKHCGIDYVLFGKVCVRLQREHFPPTLLSSDLNELTLND